MNEFDEIILTLSKGVDDIFISLNDARAENERLRAGMISIASGNENGETCRAALWRLLDREDNES